MMSAGRVRLYNFWFVIERTEDVPGEWSAHCLELDVVSQGASIQHAIEMLAEACTMVLTEDLSHGRDPAERRAPDEFWAKMYSVVREGRPIDIGTADEADVRVVAGQVTFVAMAQASAGEEVSAPPSQRPSPKVPVAWKQPARSSAPCQCGF